METRRESGVHRKNKPLLSRLANPELILPMHGSQNSHTQNGVHRTALLLFPMADLGPVLRMRLG